MPKLHLLFSHQLTDEQKQDAQQSWGIDTFVPLPDQLQKLWSNVPPTLAEHELHSYLKPLREHFLYAEIPNSKDFALVQGEFGATFEMITFLHKIGVDCLYATTQRQNVEVLLPDGSVSKQAVFRHVRFRKYWR